MVLCVNIKLPDAIIYMIGDRYHLQACSRFALDLMDGEWIQEISEDALEDRLYEFERCNLWVRISSLPNL